MVRLALHRASGTAHYGVVLPDGAVTACATVSPDWMAIAERTAHTDCRACSRALLALTTPAHPGLSLIALPATGTGKSPVGHQMIPGHLLGHCGKPLDHERTPSARACRACAHFATVLQRLKERAHGLLLPAHSPCHGEPGLLGAPLDRGNLVTGHRSNALTGKGFCETPLSGPNPGALNVCAPCQRHGREADAARRDHTLLRMREHADALRSQVSTAFDGRASVLRAGDAYTVSGCSDAHYVVATTDLGGSHIDTLVYLPAEDRIADLRLHRDRLLAIQRPASFRPVASRR
ncbi:hypothetical protein A8W25_28270 [Streptomyces sp. ERV7]|uniref:hypothetical protein n=1 Tax=Streptomyces sp. ERV7 TaxID=1322334 RepID=UPI0007F448F8|nr:hypothetical protein [Streptomyces sp. ERV7]OAR26739.1 hypothetical protein A8W25_28270 [Streptomyces sp. ERV7]